MNEAFFGGIALIRLFVFLSQELWCAKTSCRLENSKLFWSTRPSHTHRVLDIQINRKHIYPDKELLGRFRNVFFSSSSFFLCDFFQPWHISTQWLCVELWHFFFFFKLIDLLSQTHFCKFWCVFLIFADKKNEEQRRSRRTRSDPEQRRYRVNYDVEDETSLVAACAEIGNVCFLRIHTHTCSLSALWTHTILLLLLSQQDLMGRSRHAEQ